MEVVEVVGGYAGPDFQVLEIKHIYSESSQRDLQEYIHFMNRFIIFCILF
jgi:hypothetical protein